MMTVIPCPEDGCTGSVSTKASSCPHCGFPIQEYLEDTLDNKIFGIPADPFDYWVTWHIWYWRMENRPEISYTESPWVHRCMPVITIPGIKVESPVSGLNLGVKALEDAQIERSTDISHIYPARVYFAIQLRKRQDVTNWAFNMYPYLQDYLRHKVKRHEARKGIWKFFIPDETMGGGLDPRNVFGDTDALLQKIDDLAEVKPIILDI